MAQHSHRDDVDLDAVDRRDRESLDDGPAPGKVSLVDIATGHQPGSRHGLPGRVTRTMRASAVQRRGGAHTGGDPLAIAAAGVAGSAAGLPHHDEIQRAFGHHDLGTVRAHTGAAADTATADLGASAYAIGDDVAFGRGATDLFTAAHEAAHVIQQRAGLVGDGLGAPDHHLEHHADQVAARVTRGESAEDLLDGIGAGPVSAPAVQRRSIQRAPGAATTDTGVPIAVSVPAFRMERAVDVFTLDLIVGFQGSATLERKAHGAAPKADPAAGGATVTEAKKAEILNGAERTVREDTGPHQVRDDAGWEIESVSVDGPIGAGPSIGVTMKFKNGTEARSTASMLGENLSGPSLTGTVTRTLASVLVYEDTEYQLRMNLAVTGKVIVRPNWPEIFKRLLQRYGPELARWVLRSASAELVGGVAMTVIAIATYAAMVKQIEDVKACQREAQAAADGFRLGYLLGLGISDYGNAGGDAAWLEKGRSEGASRRTRMIDKILAHPAWAVFNFSRTEVEHALDDKIVQNARTFSQDATATFDRPIKAMHVRSFHAMLRARWWYPNAYADKDACNVCSFLGLSWPGDVLGGDTPGDPQALGRNGPRRSVRMPWEKTIVPAASRTKSWPGATIQHQLLPPTTVVLPKVGPIRLAAIAEAAAQASATIGYGPGRIHDIYLDVEDGEADQVQGAPPPGKAFSGRGTASIGVRASAEGGATGKVSGTITSLAVPIEGEVGGGLEITLSGHAHEEASAEARLTYQDGQITITLTPKVLLGIGAMFGLNAFVEASVGTPSTPPKPPGGGGLPGPGLPAFGGGTRPADPRLGAGGGGSFPGLPPGFPTPPTMPGPAPQPPTIPQPGGPGDPTGPVPGPGHKFKVWRKDWELSRWEWDRRLELTTTFKINVVTGVETTEVETADPAPIPWTEITTRLLAIAKANEKMDPDGKGGRSIDDDRPDEGKQRQRQEMRSAWDDADDSLATIGRLLHAEWSWSAGARQAHPDDDAGKQVVAYQARLTPLVDDYLRESGKLSATERHAADRPDVGTRECTDVRAAASSMLGRVEQISSERPRVEAPGQAPASSDARERYQLQERATMQAGERAKITASRERRWVDDEIRNTGPDPELAPYRARLDGHDSELTRSTSALDRLDGDRERASEFYRSHDPEAGTQIMAELHHRYENVQFDVEQLAKRRPQGDWDTTYAMVEDGTLRLRPEYRSGIRARFYGSHYWSETRARILAKMGATQKRPDGQVYWEWKGGQLSPRGDTWWKVDSTTERPTLAHDHPPIATQWNQGGGPQPAGNTTIQRTRQEAFNCVGQDIEIEPQTVNSGKNTGKYRPEVTRTFRGQ